MWAAFLKHIRSKFKSGENEKFTSFFQSHQFYKLRKTLSWTIFTFINWYFEDFWNSLILVIMYNWGNKFPESIGHIWYFSWKYIWPAKAKLEISWGTSNEEGQISLHCWHRQENLACTWRQDQATTPLYSFESSLPIFNDSAVTLFCKMINTSFVLATQ